MKSTEFPALDNSVFNNLVFQSAVNLWDDAASLVKVKKMKTSYTKSVCLTSSLNQVLELLRKTL